MTYPFFSLADRFTRLRARHVVPIEKRTRAIGIARTKSVLRGMRTNPELHHTEDSTNVLGQLVTVLRNRRIRGRWQRDLRKLDDRLLRDIGVSRADAEQATQRLRVWI
jgi:uncharacterized protein YjiS (DUF1127 family)